MYGRVLSSLGRKGVNPFFLSEILHSMQRENCYLRWIVGGKFLCALCGSAFPIIRRSLLFLLGEEDGDVRVQCVFRAEFEVLLEEGHFDHGVVVVSRQPVVVEQAEEGMRCHQK